MDDNEKKITSFKSDQEILDARGINLTVEEVAGLSTNKYAERVKSLRLNGDDMAFLKGLRRRIKNRLASQNSRRRSMEHLRQLNRELRVVRQCREDALSERRVLVRERDAMRDACAKLRQFCCKVLQERSDPTEVPKFDVERIPTSESLPPPKEPKIVTVTETKTPLISECFQEKLDNKSILECSIEKLVQKSVNHLYNNNNKNDKKVSAKTVFISNDTKTSCIRHTSQVTDGGITQTDLGKDLKSMLKKEDTPVLNLSVKEGRRSHGRKQTAPRRIIYVNTYEDYVLDLKIKKETE